MNNFKWFLILMLLVLLVACTNPVAPTAVTKLIHLKIGFGTTAGTQSIYWYAIEKGFFQKYGLEVEQVLISGTAKALTALVVGEVDFTNNGASSVASAVAAGQDAVIIGGVYNTFPFLLMVTPDIKSAADLKGKALAIVSPASAGDLATRAALKHFGLQPDKDVAILSVGDDVNRIAAMENGQVAGTIFTPPYTAIARAKGYHELLDLGTFLGPFQYNSIVTTRKFIKENRTVVVNYMKAVSAATAAMKNDPEGFNVVLAKYWLMDTQKDANVLQDAYAVLVQKNLEKIPLLSEPAVQNALDSLLDINPAAAKLKLQDIADLSIFQELESSGFFSNLYK